MQLVHAGTVRASSPPFAARLWAVTDSRQLVTLGAAGNVTVSCESVPGSAAVLACDPFGEPMAVLDDGAMFVLRSDSKSWRRVRAAEDIFMETKLIAGGVELAYSRRKVWTVATDRVVRLLSVEGRAVALAGGAAVPGAPAAVLTVILDSQPLALLADGTLLIALPNAWRALGNVFEIEASGLVPVRVTTGFGLPGGESARPGDVLEVSVARARDLIGKCFVEPCDEGAA